MLYESRIIDGQLQYRTSPSGKWLLSSGKMDDAAFAMARLTDEQRIEVMSLFCRECGCVQKRGRVCQCANDE